MRIKIDKFYNYIILKLNSLSMWCMNHYFCSITIVLINFLYSAFVFCGVIPEVMNKQDMPSIVSDMCILISLIIVETYKDKKYIPVEWLLFVSNLIFVVIDFLFGLKDLGYIKLAPPSGMHHHHEID